MPLQIDALTTEVTLEPETGTPGPDDRHQREQLARHLAALRHEERQRLRATALTEGCRRCGP